jgi:hypothetical protein
VRGAVGNRDYARRLINVFVGVVGKQMVDSHQREPIAPRDKQKRQGAVCTSHHAQLILHISVRRALQSTVKLTLTPDINFVRLEPQRLRIRSIQQTSIRSSFEKVHPSLALICNNVWFVEIERAAEFIQRQVFPKDAARPSLNIFRASKCAPASEYSSVRGICVEIQLVMSNLYPPSPSRTHAYTYDS